jgi:hypothetical protein
MILLKILFFILQLFPCFNSPIYELNASTLGFFLQLSWEIKSLDSKKYIFLSEKLNEIGKMLGGWIKSLK